MAEQIGKNAARFTFAEIKEATGSLFHPGWANSEVNGISTDTRAVAKDNLFVALRGDNFDGHNYLQQAIDSGAKALLVSDTNNKSSLFPFVIVPDTLEALGKLANFHRKRFQIPIIAVTGSYGKTSTRALIHAALSSTKPTLTSQGNFNNEIGLPMTLFQLDSSHQAAVLEMGMRGRGQIEYLARIAEPTVGVVTNIGPQHIELLGSVENIARAKAELLEQLPADGLAVLPADSPWIEFLKSKAPCRIVTFGSNANADYRATNIETDARGNIRFDLRFVDESISISLPLPGAHNAVNAAAAFAVAHGLKIEPPDIKRGLESAEVPGARMRVVTLPNGATLIDDCYNAGPDSMRAALQTLLDFPASGKRVAILGAMKELGEWSDSEHRKIGTVAGAFVDELIGVGSETKSLLEAAEEVGNEMKVTYCDDAQEAANRAKEWVGSGDVVLVKGSRSVGLERVVEALRNGC